MLLFAQRRVFCLTILRLEPKPRGSRGRTPPRGPPGHPRPSGWYSGTSQAQQASQCLLGANRQVVAGGGGGRFVILPKQPVFLYPQSAV
jgi:hypothetical protein